MTSTIYDVEKTRLEMFVDRINREIKDIDKDSERYKYLMNVLEGLPRDNSENLTTVLEKVSSSVYGKEWRKLPEFHKIQKIKQYLSEKYGDEDYTEIEKKIIKLVSEKKLGTAKCVEYDTKTMSIKKIIVSKEEIY